jgi:2-keto-4-pentenoate hydratase/2-oxohepta-3-ene-1,7-dioic acid hydratase in catechol pathway
MIYATAIYEGKEQIFSVDGAGCRVFPLTRFFEEVLGLEQGPASMQDLIAGYDPDWTDQIAFFFGSHPELALTLHDVRLIAPIPSPKRNVVCLGKNYAEHARELAGQLFWIMRRNWPS